MTRFTVKDPLDAEQYDGAGSVKAVAALVRKYRPGVSYTTAHGPLHFHSSGPDLIVELSDWVVAFGDDVIVVKPDVLDRWARITSA